ncbi:MAG TPA: hypothetical protein PKC41_03025 [Chitinophagaceae bacterium]|jgi:hypothetical protein|nr:hypothetical protein [Chitinophagaceae bacterium]
MYIKYLLLFIPFFSNAQMNDNYNLYFDLINKAEKSYFLDKNVDSAYYYFNKAFKTYDFVFVKDCMEAAQIAIIHKSDKYVFEYLKKAFENGFKISKLYDIGNLAGDNSPFDEIDSTLTLYANLKNAYPKARAKFLKRINMNVLNIITKVAAIDRAFKNNPYPYFKNSLFEKNFKVIDSLLNQGLYPSEKIVGVDQVNIFKETGKNYFDLNDWYFILKDKSGAKTYQSLFDLDETEFLSRLAYVPLYHCDSAYVYLKKHAKMLISKGLMHPRELATLHDLYLSKFYIRAYERGKKNSPFGKDISEGNNILFFDISQEYRTRVNELRASYHINTVETDSAKSAFEKKHKTILFTTFIMNR